MLKAAKVIFSINEDCRRFCEDHLRAPADRRKIKDVHHYIDYRKIRTFYEAADTEAGRSVKRIIFWGRIAGVKGLDLVIRAVRHLKSEGQNIQFNAVGAGSERFNLEKITENEGLREDILFPGRCPIETIAAWAKNSDVFVMSSHTEGIPTSMLEAMAFGLPVVSTAVGGIPTLIQDGVNGYLIGERNPAHFAEGIKQAFQMNRNKVNEHNTALITKSYSVEAVVAQMDAMMASAVQDPSFD